MTEMPRILVGYAKLGEALILLRQFGQNVSELEDQLIGFYRKYYQGLISENEKSIILNRIASSILRLCENIEDYDKSN
jgi:Effector-associated domain 11